MSLRKLRAELAALREENVLLRGALELVTSIPKLTDAQLSELIQNTKVAIDAARRGAEGGNQMSNIRERYEEMIENYPDGDEVIFFDGLDEAIVGLDTSNLTRLVYSDQRIIKILMERDGMDEEGAREFYEYNIEGLHAGKHTPLIVHEPR